MKVWVVKTSEMIAEDGNRGRLLRSGLVANMLDARGHDVTWWMSTFDHANRRNRALADVERDFGERGRIRMLYSPGYQKTISVRRLADHLVWGRRFAGVIRHQIPPELIFCAYPTIESAWVSVRYAKTRHIPVVLDLRDMWPDILAEAKGPLVGPLLRCALSPWNHLARQAMRGATSLFAITEEFLAWGLAKAGRQRRITDAAFPLAYPDGTATANNSDDDFWDRLGVHRQAAFNVIFIGALNGRSYRMEPVFAAARTLSEEHLPVRFIICGDGDDLQRLRTVAADHHNVLLPGWISAPQVRALLSRAHLGLVPYRNTPDLLITVPNKAAEYFSAGVPVATSLRGTLARVLKSDECGFAYDDETPSTLTAQIRSLAFDRPRQGRLGEHARDLFQREYRAEDVYNRLIDRLEEIAAPARATR